MKNNLNWIRTAMGGLIIVCLAGCAANKLKPMPDFDQYFRDGVQDFNKRKWDKAIDKFTLVIINTPGGEFADDAQFYLGECYFGRKEYLLAISEYHQLIDRYAWSEYVEQAAYKIALSEFKASPRYQLEQDNSIKSLQSFQDFIDTYPKSQYIPDAEQKINEIRSKLARKLFESGRLYRKLQEWHAAIVYLDKVQELYYDTEWADKARLEKAYCLIRLREFDQYNLLIKEIIARTQGKIDQAAIEYLRVSYRKELTKVEKEQHQRAD